MGRNGSPDGIENRPVPGTPDFCPLGARQQTQNLILYSINTGLIYLAAPVLYVGTVHASFCKKLEAPDTISNLPSTLNFVAAATPLLVAWYFPYVSSLKKVIVVCFGVNAVMEAIVVATLLGPAPGWVKVAVMIVQGAVSGCTLFTAVAFMWEVLGRAVAASRRGLTLSLAFGVGPILAVIGSLASQLILTGKVQVPAIDFHLHFAMVRIEIPEIKYPWNFAALFAAGVPIMALAALLSSLFVVPQPAQEVTRQGFLTGVFGGVGDFLGNRTLLTVAIVAVLVYSGGQIHSNMTLYTEQALGEAPEESAGYQLAVRFSFKCVTGLLLGWLLTKTHAKAGVLATALLSLAAIEWALLTTGNLFLLSFGLYGAGELFGVYGPNYILCCSARNKMRRNMALATLLVVPAAPAGVLFGGISDYFKNIYSPALAFQFSLAAAGALVGAAILLTLWLPARPQPEEPEVDAPGS